jgi:hypothetical protein
MLSFRKAFILVKESRIWGNTTGNYIINARLKSRQATNPKSKIRLTHKYQINRVFGQYSRLIGSIFGKKPGFCVDYQSQIPNRYRRYQ